MRCESCRSIGYYHCSDPINCGNMKDEDMVYKALDIKEEREYLNKANDWIEDHDLIVKASYYLNIIEYYRLRIQQLEKAPNVDDLLEYPGYDYEWQSGEYTTAPEVLWANADFEVGDCSFGIHSSPKYADEPSIPYIRLDLYLKEIRDA